ncbi:hypothetical protein AC626_08465 [Pseudoalteromonas rubra]|uniref:Uncharacterized protein n=1 Tax=Pseudoalteromonas rubra TaxID=43658 RepID=A0A0L0EVA9_9GAMM|nr:hypothetical protein AC626_08465 [Pseudoalteromonas rubra]
MNYPKSKVVFILCILSGIAIGLLGFFLKQILPNYLYFLLVLVLWGLILTSFVCFFINLYGSLTGKYKSLKKKSWKEQVW